MSFWQDKRVIVTGGGGFIGTHVLEHLEQRQANQVFVVRHNDYDLTDEKQVEALYQDHPADIVIHLAGLVGGILPNRERPAEFFYQNLMMGTLIFHYAWKSGAQKFLAAGAGCGYPQFAPNPLKEDDLWSGFPQQESAPYSLAKRLLTTQARAYWEQHQFVSIIGIPGNVYGPYDNFHLGDAHVIPALVRKFVEATDSGADSVEVWGSGNAARDFVYAGDIADGFLTALEKYNESVVVNLSSGEETPIRDIVEILQDVSGFKGEITWNTDRPDGQLHRRFDTSKALSELGWTTTTSLRDGLKKTVDWYRANKDDARK
jgi:GDP-L-fucose synthase